MSKLIPSAFASYEQSPQEQIVGSSYSQEQLEFIQNQISAIATSRFNIEVNPNNYSEFIQQEAYAKGQMDTYRYLLDCHTANQEALLALSQQSPQ